MLNIDQAIIFKYNEKAGLTGNIFYLLDYFFFIQQYNKDIKLVMIDTPEYWLDNLIRNKYSNVDTSNIIYLKYYDVLKTTFKQILTTDRVYIDMKRLFRADNIMLIRTWYSLNTPNSTEELLIDKRVELLNECEELGTINYIRKIWFDNLKCESNPNTVFFHMSNHRIITEEIFNKILETIPNYDDVLIYTYDNEETRWAEKYDNVKMYDYNIDDLFNRFKYYVHYLPNTIDCAPRLLMESAYLNKEIIWYMPNNNCIGAGLQRYKDILADNIMKYNLTKDDYIVSKFI